IVPQLARNAGVNCVAVLWVNDDLDDALGILQPHVGPVLAAVGGFVNAITDGGAIARPRFASTNPNSFRSRGINRDRTDGLHWLLVKDRLISRATVFRLPNTSAGGADVNREPAVFFHRSQSGYTAAHFG